MGGGAYFKENVVVTIGGADSRVRLEGNSCPEDGGLMYINGFGAGKDVRVELGAGTSASRNSAKRGGAVFCYHGTVSTHSVFLERNEAAWGGAAVWVGEGSALAAVETSFSSNAAWRGAALFVVGEAIVRGCALSHNTAGLAGAAVHVNEYGRLAANTSVFSRNVAPEGAAIDATFLSVTVLQNVTVERSVGASAIYLSHATASLRHCSLSRNQGPNVLAVKGSDVTCARCRFQHGVLFAGSAVFDGGGIVVDSSTARVKDSIFASLSCTRIGGAGVCATARSRAVLEGCTFDSNTAAGYGGGLVLFFQTLSPFIFGVTRVFSPLFFLSFQEYSMWKKMVKAPSALETVQNSPKRGRVRTRRPSRTRRQRRCTTAPSKPTRRAKAARRGSTRARPWSRPPRAT